MIFRQMENNGKYYQMENIIRLVVNIYPSMDLNLLSTESYNYTPLIGYDFHFV